MIYLWIALLAVVVTAGIIEIKGALKFSKVRSCFDTIVTIHVKGENEQTEYLIRKLIHKYAWHSDERQLSIVVIDDGMSPQTLEVVEALRREFNYIYIVSGFNLEDTIKYIINLQNKTA